MEILKRSRFNQLQDFTVLIVSNQASFSLYVSLMAQQLSAKNTISIANTILATRSLKKNKYDLILLDETCTPLSPVAFVQYLRYNALHPNYKTPIIIMSDQDNAGHFYEVTHKYYAQNLLFKPFQMQDLNECAEKCRVAPVTNYL